MGVQHIWVLCSQRGSGKTGSGKTGPLNVPWLTYQRTVHTRLERLGVHYGN